MKDLKYKVLIDMPHPKFKIVVIVDDGGVDHIADHVVQLDEMMKGRFPGRHVIYHDRDGNAFAIRYEDGVAVGEKAPSEIQDCIRGLIALSIAHPKFNELSHQALDEIVGEREAS
jgi:hypothetical protein